MAQKIVGKISLIMSRIKQTSQYLIKVEKQNLFETTVLLKMSARVDQKKAFDKKRIICIVYLFCIVCFYVLCLFLKYVSLVRNGS